LLSFIAQVLRVFQEEIMRTLEITDLDFEQPSAIAAQTSGGVSLSLSTGIQFKLAAVEISARAKANGNSTLAGIFAGTLSLKNSYGSLNAGVGAAAGGAVSGNSGIAGGTQSHGVIISRAS
jgi:hypothetical protein